MEPAPVASSLSFSENAFECDSPAAILASQRTPANAAAFASARLNRASLDSGPGASSHHTNQQLPSHITSANGSHDQPQHHHARHAQLPLESQSINSQDLDDGAVEYGELAQPRAEIVLRWKRFALLVLVAAAAISGATALLVRGLPMTKVAAKDAEDRVDWINSISGIVMGFGESVLGLLLGELLPVFIVYLHNLKWFPGDDPAMKVSKFKKIALMLFIPLVMVALGNSFSAVQANQRTTAETDRRMRTRHLQQPPPPLHALHSHSTRKLTSSSTAVAPLEQTVLRSALSRRVLPAPPPLRSSTCDSSDAFNALLQSLPSAAFGFPARRWHRLMYPETASWERSRSATLAPGGVFMAPDSLPVPSSTVQELLAQGGQQLGALVGAREEPTLSSLQREPRNTQEGNVSSLLLEITRRFQALELGPLYYDAMIVTLQRSPLSPLVQLDAMTVTIPVQATREESDGSRVLACGSASCVLLEKDSTSALRQLPRKHISLARYCAANSNSTDERGCRPVDDAAFLFGFTSVTSSGGHPVKPQAAALQHTLVFSFGKLSWKYDAFQSVCAPAASPSLTDCRVLHHKLASGDRHLVLGAKFVASRLSASPVRLVELVERKVAVGSARARIVSLNNGEYQRASATATATTPRGSGTSCSAAVDSYQQFVDQNHLFLDQHLVQPMYTSALWYLFQDAAVVETADAGDSAETAVARRLVDAQGRESGEYIKIYISNTRVGQISTWVGCFALLVLSALVIVLPNERARLEPPRGGNARAERFVAVQTEEAYPNFVYKKRFLIGKTGEEIKFGEFAVESVSLHHKMEEDEQIYL